MLAPAPVPRHRAARRGGLSRGAAAAVAVLPGTVLATALTLWHYSSKPLWRDEWITWSVTVRPWASMASLLSEREGGLWPFYALMHVWMRADDSLVWLRAPSAIATVLAVAATALAGRRVAGPLAGALSGVLLAALPAVVDHAQQARAYPEVTAAVALAGLAALRYREVPTAGRTAALAVLAAIAVAAHPLPGVPAVAGILAALVLAPGAASRRRTALAGLPAATVGIVLVGVGAGQVGLVLTADPGGWATVERFRLVLAPAWWTLAVMGALAVAGALRLRRGERGTALLLTAWALTPPIFLAASVAAGSFSTRRYLVAALPAVAVLVAVGAVAVARAVARRTVPHRASAAVATGLVVVVLTGLAPHAAVKRTAPYAGDDPRSAARHVAAHRLPGDVVVHGGPFARGMTAFHAPPGALPPDPLLAGDRVSSATVDGTDLPPDLQQGAVAGARRVWAVATRDGRSLEGQDTIDRATVGRTRVERDAFGGVVVELWGPRGRGAGGDDVEPSP